MAIISCNSPPCSALNHKLPNQRSFNSQVKLPSCTIHLPARLNHRIKNGSSSCFSTNIHLKSSTFSCSAPKGCFQNVGFKVFGANYDANYVADGDESVAILSEDEESATKILIPGLPDDSRGAPIHHGIWEWKPKLNVHYEKSGCENLASPPILLLPGFGAGSFHYEKQLKDLGRDYRVWAIDFLGQGMSLPIEDPAPRSNALLWGFGDKTEPWANGLVYSTDLWCDQVRYFVEEVIGEPVYIVGNSLGGFVGLYFAACNPQLVKGVTLLNATPFWGLLPNPIRSPRLARLFPWSGKFPLPENVKKLIELVWQKISDPESIAVILRQVYADHTTNVDKVFSHIIAAAQHPAAAAAFASIIFAPRGQLSFREALSRSHMNKVPICLIYGKEDPWVKPIWGLVVKKQIPEVPYYEISPAGHCPHDEVPEVVNYLLRGWMKSLESGDSAPWPLVDDTESIEKSIAKELEFVREGARKSIKVKLYGSLWSVWAQITCYFSSRGIILERKPQ